MTTSLKCRRELVPSRAGLRSGTAIFAAPIGTIGDRWLLIHPAVGDIGLTQIGAHSEPTRERELNRIGVLKSSAPRVNTSSWQNYTPHGPTAHSDPMMTRM